MSKRATVKATAKDNGGSGIYTYKFFIKTDTERTYTEKDTITVENAEECTYIYTDLTEGASYDLMVEVRDRAGNMVQAKVATFATKDWIAKVGDYIKYTPTSGQTTALSAYTGTNSDQLFETESFNWRIWDIDEENNKLIIIADGTSSKSLNLTGAQGYNNGVYLLNAVCKKCYSNSILGGEGRSINFEDITNKMNTPPEFTDATHSLKGKVSFPIIHMYEEYSNVDGNNIPKGGESSKGVKALGLSEQKEVYTATTQGANYGRKVSVSGLQPIITDVSFALSSPDVYKHGAEYAVMSTFIGDRSSVLKEYWFASRCVGRWSTGEFYFALRYVSSGSLVASNICYTGGTNNTRIFQIPPNG